ncbi:MAG: hypothetical protein ABJA35_17450 [Parafilimonas sp.]
MKIAISLAIMFFIFNHSFAQSYTPGQSIDQSYQTHGDYMDIYDNSMHKIGGKTHPNLTGTPLLNREWGIGSVAFSNGRQVSDLPLQFNLQTNTLFFKKDSSVLAFADKVAAFRMDYDDEGEKRKVFFRSGYPDAHGKPTDFLYEVINLGSNVHFLKRLTSGIDEQYVYGSAAKENYEIKQERYVYIVKRNALVKISDNEKSISKALPEYDKQIKKFEADNNSKLDNDKEVDLLITSLNDL